MGTMIQLVIFCFCTSATKKKVMQSIGKWPPKPLKIGKKGLTLLETIVTVGLVAILTSIAVPTYRNYTRSAKTPEAQSSLGQIYMAEKSFFLQHRFYTADLLAIGAAPDGEMLYNAGFSSGDAPPSSFGGTIDSSRSSFFQLCGTGFGGQSNEGSLESCAFQNSKFKKEGNLLGTFEPPEIDSSAVTTHTSFKAFATADLINNPPQKNTPQLDKWCINQYKQVIRVRNGTRSHEDADTPCL